MAVNLGGLSRITTGVQALGNLILVSPQKIVGYQPQPVNPKDAVPQSLIFHYEGEQNVSLESDITDHYVEDNTAVQDHIALKPETVTVHGFIGELNDVVPEFLEPVKFAAEKLSTVGSFIPSLSATALLAYSEAFFLYQQAANLKNSAVDAWTSFNAVKGDTGQSSIGSDGLSKASAQNKQQIHFQALYEYWRQRRLFSVQTPWAVFRNMGIKSLRAIQDAETNQITDFEIQFKMMRTAETKSTAMGAQGRLAASTASVQDQGANSPSPGAPLKSLLGGT